MQVDRRQFIKLLIVLTALVWAAVWQWPDQRLHLWFFDVGQGDAIFIKTPWNYQILVDGGPDQTVLEGLGAVMPFYDRSLDAIILTHPHADHVVGLIEVLRRYQVDRVIANAVSYDSAEYQAFWELVNERGIPVQGFVKDQGITLADDVSLAALWPPAQTSVWEIEDVNRASMVFRLSFGQFAALLTGDAELGPDNPELVEYLTGQDPLAVAVDVLKVPHQGSQGAVTAQVLARLQPQLAVIPVGENRFGHPASEIIELLEQGGATVWRTDRQGTLEVVSDGATWYTRSGGN